MTEVRDGTGGGVDLLKVECEGGPVKNIGDLLAAVRKAMQELSCSDAWFRGNARAVWPLRPKIYWKCDSGSESKMVKEFQRLARVRHGVYAGEEDYEEWLTLMQHYGLPTRLLDWSASLIVAAHFATDSAAPESHDCPGAVWLLNHALLKPGNPHIKPALFLMAFLEPMPIGDHDEHVAPVLPKELDLRMLVQQSAFTIHGTDEALETHKDAIKFLRLIEIPPNAKTAIRAEVRLLGTKLQTLFPDLQNLASDLERVYAKS